MLRTNPDHLWPEPERSRAPHDYSAYPVQIAHPAGGFGGILNLPAHPAGLVLLAHTEPNAHFKPRHQYLTQCFALNGLGVLQTELRNASDPQLDRETDAAAARLMIERLTVTVRWAQQQPVLRQLTIGCLGFGLGGTTALMAAAALTAAIDALVIVDGDLHENEWQLANILAPTLLVVSDAEDRALQANRVAFARLHGAKDLEVINTAAHPADRGAVLGHIITLSIRWFQRHLTSSNSLGAAKAPWPA